MPESRQRTRPRAHTLSMRALSRDDMATPRVSDAHIQRPRTRGECEEGPRPCPWVGCKHHLYLDVTRYGSIKLNFPELEPWELGETCVLDVAARGASTLEQLGQLLNVSRERARQLEAEALAHDGLRELRRGE